MSTIDKDSARLWSIIAILAIAGAFGSVTYSVMKIQSVREEFKNLEPKLEELKVKTAQLEKDKKKLSNETTQLAEDKKTLQKDKEKLQKDKADLEEQIKNLPTTLAELKDKVKVAEAALRVATTNGTTLQKQLDDARDALDKKTKEVAQCQTKLTQCQTALEGIKTILQTKEDIVTSIKDLIRRNESHATEIAELRSERDSAIRDYNTAQSRLNSCKDAYRSYINAARGNAEVKPWFVQLPSYYGVSGPDAF